MKTIQEILDEQRALSKVHEVTDKGAKISAWKKGESNGKAGMPSPLKGKPSPLKGTTNKKVSNALKNVPKSENHKKKISDSRIGKANPEHSKRLTGRASPKRGIALVSKYIFYTLRGEFISPTDMYNAFPELTHAQISDYCKREVKGFSKRLKDENDSRDNG